MAPSRSFDELKKLYESKALPAKTKSSPTAASASVSSHTWFVLKYLLGFNQVRNYDGSWTEWGNLIGCPHRQRNPCRATRASSLSPLARARCHL